MAWKLFPNPKKSYIDWKVGEKGKKSREDKQKLIQKLLITTVSE